MKKQTPLMKNPQLEAKRLGLPKPGKRERPLNEVEIAAIKQAKLDESLKNLAKRVYHYKRAPNRDLKTEILKEKAGYENTLQAGAVYAERQREGLAVAEQLYLKNRARAERKLKQYETRQLIAQKHLDVIEPILTKLQPVKAKPVAPQPEEPKEEPIKEEEVEEEEEMEVFVCPHCLKGYKTEPALKGHITKYHPDKKEE